MIDPGKAFDFRAHEQAAVTAYLKRYGFYEDLASIVKRILEEALKRKGIKVYSVQARAKDPTSFGKKAPSLLSLIPRSRSILRSEEHTSELQSHHDLVCRLLLEKKKK